MSLAVQRDLEELRIGLERWLGRTVGQIERPAPGFSCETLVVEGSLVVRLPPAADGVFPAYDLAQQARVQEAVGVAGIPVASPARFEPDESFLGTPFVTMPFVAGTIPSAFTPADPWLTGLADDAARRDVWTGFLDAVVAINQAPSDGLELRAGLASELEWWDRYVSWATDGAPPPALADALRWCREHRPADDQPPSLLWGDVRLGNVIFDDVTHAPKAVLDWDMASVGPAEMDLAWFLALEEVQTELTNMTVPGFGTREEAIAHVEHGLGRPLRDMDWYETFALVRASAISTRIAILFDRAGQQSMFKVGEDPTLAMATRRIAAT